MSEEFYSYVYIVVKTIIVCAATGLFWAVVTYFIFKDSVDQRTLYIMVFWTGVVAAVVKS